MDIFGENQPGHDDDFEFKPLTNGLGFHKKTIDLSNELKKTSVTSQVLSEKVLPKSVPSSQKSQTQAESVRRLVDSFPTFDQGLEPKKQTFMTQPLPRETSREEAVPSFKNPKMGGVRFEEPKVETKTSAATFTFAESMNMTASKVANKISADPMPQAIKEVPFSISAFIFDMFMVTGLTFLFTGIVLAVTAADLAVVLENAQTDVPTRLSLVILLLAVIQMYVVLSRSFFGRTIGDWAFDVQLGNSQQQKSAWYPILVGWRALLVMLTGFVTLPILSIISRRDVTAFLTGVRTYRVQ